MNIIIFGATGGTGIKLIYQGLEAGHNVTAFCRTPSKITKFHPNLSVVQGDALDIGSVTDALAGQDAVFCALGKADIRDKSQLRAKATSIIVKAVNSTKVKRLICLSAFGAGESLHDMPWHYRYLIMPLVMKHLYIDHNLQESALEKSGLDWTIIRPAILTDGPFTGRYLHGSKLPKSASLKISRADVAAFMLTQLDSSEYLHKAPSISY